MQAAVIFSPTVGHGPYGRCYHRKQHVKEVLDISESGITASRLKVCRRLSAQIKDMGSYPRRQLLPGPPEGICEPRATWQHVERSGRDIENQIGADPAEKNSLRQAPRRCGRTWIRGLWDNLLHLRWDCRIQGTKGFRVLYAGWTVVTSAILANFLDLKVNLICAILLSFPYNKA